MDNNFRKKFIKGSAATFIGQFSSMTFHFASLMLLTRALTKEEFGLYALIIVINSIMLIISGMGLDITTVKFISSDTDKEKKNVFFPIITIKILILLIFAILFLSTSNIISSMIHQKLAIYLIYIPMVFVPGGIRDLLYKVIQAIRYFKKYAIIQNISAVTRFSLLMLFYSQEMLDLSNLIIIEIFIVLLIVIVQIILIPFNILSDKKVKKIELKTIFQFALPIYISNIFGYMYQRINVIIVGALLTPVSVAFFDVGNKIPAAFQKMFNSFILVFFPNLSNLLSKGNSQSGEELINKSLIFFSLLMSIVILILFLFRNEIMILLFTEKYLESSLVFSILLLNLIINIFKNILGYSIVAAGFPKVPMKVNVFSSFIGIGGSLFLIPQFGYVGAALALILTNSFSQTLYLFYLKRVNLIVQFFRYFSPVMVLISVILLYYILDNHSIIMRILTIVIYLILNWFLISDFKSLIKKLRNFNY